MFNFRKAANVFGRAVYRSSSLYSTSTVPIAAQSAKIDAQNDKTTDVSAATTAAAESASSSQIRSKNPMVAAVFDSLKNENVVVASAEDGGGATKSNADEIDDRIINAKSVIGLLSVADGNASVTRKHALKIVSILAEWSSINRVQLADFENDARFIKLCRLLGRAVPKNQQQQQTPNGQSTKISGFRTDDLNTVIGVAGDDEAAKLIASISIPQMIKVMSALAQKKRRSTPLLRSLAYNISSNSAQLDLKQCADLLYAMAVLNFPDSVLISRISMDVQSGLAQNTDKPAAVGSIITSLGLLKYRDADLLESLCDWVLQHFDICRPQDVSSLFLTLATLNYATTKSDMVKTKLSTGLVQNDFGKSLDWLTNVWALVVLNMAEPQQIASILKPEFLKKLVTERGADLTPTIKMKLLNIEAAASLLLKDDYKGSHLPTDSSVYDVPLGYSKNKQILVTGLLDALKSLFPSETYVRTCVDTKMGFVIDAECVFDAKLNPLPVDQNHKDAVRLAIMVLDFHDMSTGAHQQASGITSMSYKLLEQKGYKILTVPYNEFNTSDKLLKRVQYLEAKLKRIVNSKI